MKLFFIILGCKPNGRNTEQHDVFFGIGNSLKDLLPQIETFWPGGGKIHIDSWREINTVENFAIKIIPKTPLSQNNSNKLFFLNLGGYKPNDMEEYHYKVLVVANNKADAIDQAKQTAFFKHNVFSAHIDDKYGIDVDDVFEIEEMLPENLISKYSIEIKKTDGQILQDELKIGYLKLSSL